VLGTRRAPLERTVVREGRGPTVAMIEIEGTIRASERRIVARGGESTVARVREQLDRAREDEAAGLLLRIDSPGGGATASEILYRELAAFKQEQRVPVVAQLMGMAASGGYYAAMAADHIVAYPTSVTGSVGAIFVHVSLAGLMEKLGIADQTVASGPRKDVASPLRSMTPAERAELQRVIDDLSARFREVVARGRPALPPETLARVAEGRLYSAPQAYALGLVDAIGGLDDAISELERRLGRADVRVVSYHRPSEWRRNLYTQAPPVPTLAAELGTLLGELAPEPGFYYLWWPAAE
jgi:protease-4